MMTLEMGKPLVQARNEALKCARGMRFYAANAERFLADEILEDPSAVGASRAYSIAQPLGVVLAVMPWNLPMWQVIRFAGPALMAGNAGLLKHASNVPQIATYLDTLFERAGFPLGAFHTLLIGSGEGRGGSARFAGCCGDPDGFRGGGTICRCDCRRGNQEVAARTRWLGPVPRDALCRSGCSSHYSVTARMQNNG
jgi:Aldehyde dehydrogenase family